MDSAWQQEAELWAWDHGWRHIPSWPELRGRFLGIDHPHTSDRIIEDGIAGTYGDRACFGFRAVSWTGLIGPVHVLGIQVKRARFPLLCLERMGPPSSEARFDSVWRASGNARLADDVLTRKVQAHLLQMPSLATRVWFEHDAVLVGGSADIAPHHLDVLLADLSHLIDLLPSEVVEKVTGRRRPRPTQETWRQWTAARRWIFQPNARDLAERVHHSPLPSTPGGFINGFIGRFSESPCFGWHTAGGKRCHVVCVRRPGLAMSTVRITPENRLLAELVGAGDITIGDPHFDDAWHVSSPDPDGARGLLRPQVWRHIDSDHRPAFAQLWLERDIVAVITDRILRPEEIDHYLGFLRAIALDLPAPASGDLDDEAAAPLG